MCAAPAVAWPSPVRGCAALMSDSDSVAAAGDDHADTRASSGLLAVQLARVGRTAAAAAAVSSTHAQFPSVRRQQQQQSSSPPLTSSPCSPSPLLSIQRTAPSLLALITQCGDQQPITGGTQPQQQQQQRQTQRQGDQWCDGGRTRAAVAGGGSDSGDDGAPTMGFQITSVGPSRLASEHEEDDDDEQDDDEADDTGDDAPDHADGGRVQAALQQRQQSRCGLETAVTCAATGELDRHQWHGRFKVITIALNDSGGAGGTGVPYSRGRWLCVDSVRAAANGGGDNTIVHRRSVDDDTSVVTWHATSHVPRAALAGVTDGVSRQPATALAAAGACHVRQRSAPVLHSFSPHDTRRTDVSSQLHGRSSVSGISNAALVASSGVGSGGGGCVSKDVEPIDNKIGQAMDLVKSHLLLAVREEVDVLKASIGSLMERISSLERENAALRGCVSADVLVQAEHLRRGGSVTSRPAAATVSCSSPSSCTSPTQHTSGGTTCACVAGSPSDGACSASTATQHQQTQQR